jgi:peptide/nickel transport system permease protein
MTPRTLYFIKRAGWYFITFLFALLLNFVLPRLGPTDPVDIIIGNMDTEGMTTDQVDEMRLTYQKAFNLDQPVFTQFVNYVARSLRGDLGISSINYPRTTWEIISEALPWSLALTVPAILLAWLVGNAVGALAAYKRGLFDQLLYPLALFLASIPFFCFGLLLVSGFYVELGWVNSLGAYSPDRVPSFTTAFLWDALGHYWLPFLSIFLIIVGGQAIGMRSLAIYELGTDYVRYAKSLGISENRILFYVFRNAMLPQLTGLALALGTMVGGSLITELIFSYPGLGHLMLNAIRKNDYPLIQGITLLVTTSVLALNFCVDISIGILDPRIRAGQKRERA